MKTRFAPSPTGYLHLGNARTALFSALMAVAQKGHFLLRIEDTDQARSSQEFADQLQRDLKWLELNWQEGPFYQSKRHAIYEEHYQKLANTDYIYPCFCTDQELAIARKVQLSSSRAPRYLGTCRGLSAEQVAAKRAQGLKPTLRFSVPAKQVIQFEDFVRGPQSFMTDDIGDFIIQRADGTAPFFFCNAIDDALMNVTHVLRGEDHLTNTPRQLLILKALNLPLPHYGHIALIVGQDGAPLSKRHGSLSVQEMQSLGYLPQAVMNYLARLGHYYVSNDLMDLETLAAHFSMQSLGKAPAQYDPAQLLYWQKQAVMQLSQKDLWDWLAPAISLQVPDNKKEMFLAVIHPNIVFPEKAQYWAERFFNENLVYSDEAKMLLKQAGADFFKKTILLLQEMGNDFKALSTRLGAELNLKGKALFQPLRIATTGQSEGPEMAGVFQLLGVEALIKRFNQVIKLIS